MFEMPKEHNMKRNIKGFIVSGFLASSLGAAVSIPNSFSAGTPIKASDVNANFSSLKTAIDALEGGSGVKVPLNLSGTGTGISGSTIQAQNTNGGIGATISQSKTGASDGALVVIQSGDGPLLRAFGKNGGEDEFRVDSSGTITLRKPDNTANITLDNNNGRISAPSINVVGAGTGIAGSTLSAQNTNGGIGATISQSKTGASDGALVVIQSGDGAIFKGFGKNGGNNAEFTVDTNGTVSATSFNATSDRNAKTNFLSVNALEVLNKVARLPISRWNYKTDNSSLQHVGPMAQDFHAAFGLNGSDDKHLNAVDVQGVTLAAIQGLNRKLEQKSARISELEQQLLALEDRLNVLEKR
jgi:hypothetical protein